MQAGTSKKQGALQNSQKCWKSAAERASSATTDGRIVPAAKGGLNAVLLNTKYAGKPKLLQVKKQLKETRAESLRNITAEEGILLKMCRSIQVEGAFGLLKNNFAFGRFFHREKEYSH